MNNAPARISYAMKVVFILCSFLCISFNSHAQFHDNHWLLGYAGGEISEPDDSFGISILSFYEGDLTIENNQSIDLEFDGAGNSFSDFAGNLLLFSNGLEIRNRDDVQLINGDFNGSFGDPESIITQSFVFLPHSEDLLDISFVRMLYTEDLPRLGGDVEHFRINPYFEDNGLLYDGTRLSVLDSLATGELTACRHANGRDWWLLFSKANQQMIYTVLISPTEFEVRDSIEMDFPLYNGLGQSLFSPDGNRYIRVNLIGGINGDDYLDVFDFDRCTGMVSNQRQINIGANASAGGAAISPSSRYLYVSHYNHIYQYDLLAADISETKDTVATYDGYLEWNFFHSRFFQAQLAPDGKIYLNSPSGVKVLSVINQPDEAGTDVDVAQHSIPLPNNNAFTLANHPNYRLGPVDGSVCDTLGIDNLPRAYYRIDRNPEDTLNFHFQDLSFYVPTSWLWTFGDGASSVERHPDHTYQNSGIYEVCLTASNDLGSDTHCRTLELGPVAVDDLQQLTFGTFPNPVQDVLVFDLGQYYPLNGQFRLHNAAGQLVFSKQVLHRQTRMQFAKLPAGVYFYEFWDDGMKLGQGKVLKH